MSWQSLLDRGYRNLVCFTRPSSEPAELEAIIERRLAGGSRRSVPRQSSFPRQIVKLLARMWRLSFTWRPGTGEKSFPDAFMNSVVTTRNLLEASLRYRTSAEIRPHQFVRGVYQSASSPTAPGRIVPDRRASGATRRRLLLRQGEAGTNRHRIRQEFRHSLCHGQARVGLWSGRHEVTGRVGIGTFGLFLHLGGSNTIPFTYVDNCAEAIVLAGLVKGVDGEVFNVVDDDLPSSRQFSAPIQEEREDASNRSMCPMLLSYVLCYLWEKYVAMVRRTIAAGFQSRADGTPNGGRRATATEIENKLGWTPKVSTEEGLRRYFRTDRDRVNSMLKVAIVGCGKIADAHAAQIQRIEGCEIVGVCDREPLMARQLYERFPVKGYFTRS